MKMTMTMVMMSGEDDVRRGGEEGEERGEDGDVQRKTRTPHLGCGELHKNSVK